MSSVTHPGTATTTSAPKKISLTTVRRLEEGAITDKRLDVVNDLIDASRAGNKDATDALGRVLRARAAAHTKSVPK